MRRTVKNQASDIISRNVKCDLWQSVAVTAIGTMVIAVGRKIGEEVGKEIGKEAGKAASEWMRRTRRTRRTRRN